MSSNDSRLVIFVGPKKTGTTWIDSKLRGHEFANLPVSRKELFYWDSYFDRGEHWYNNQFKSPDIALRIEVAPSIFNSTEALTRLTESCQKLNVIITLRDPVDRAISHYYHHRRMGRIGPGLIEGCKKIPEIIDSSRYTKYVPMWKKSIDSDNLLFISFNELFQSGSDSTDKISSVIDCSPEIFKQDLEGKVNSRGAPRIRMLASASTKVFEYLRDKNIEWPIRIGKAIGLRKIYSGGEIKEEISEKENEWLAKELCADTQLFEELFRRGT